VSNASFVLDVRYSLHQHFFSTVSFVLSARAFVGLSEVRVALGNVPALSSSLVRTGWSGASIIPILQLFASEASRCSL